MRNALLIAWREFADNIRTKGFWIGICLFPIIIFASFRVPIWLETKGAPTRHFVLIDQSGQFGQLIDGQLERDHQQRVLDSLNEYAGKYQAGSIHAQSNAPSIETRSPFNRSSVLPDPLKAYDENNPQRLDAYLKQGGKENYLNLLKPFLASNALAFIEPKRLFVRVPLPSGMREGDDLNTLAQTLKPYLRGAAQHVVDQKKINLYAAVLIPPDVERHIVRPENPVIGQAAQSNGIQYWSANLADMKLREVIERAVNEKVRQREYAARGLDVAAVRQVQKTYIPFAGLNPKKEAGKEKVGPEDMIRQWAPSAFVYLLWLAIFAIAQALLNNTIEEKSNRIIEVLLSSVTPGELMLGKLIGITAVGLTMIGSWIVTMVGMVAWQSHSALNLTTPLLNVLRTSNLIPAFALYFILGFIMYAGIILSIGSVCNTIKEAQNYMGVITMVMIVPLLTLMFIPKDPNGTLATVLSWIPFYTPFVMMNRITSDPPLRDLVGTLILLVATAGFVLWMSGRIFRIGILRTGQPPKLIEMFRWIKG